MSYSYRINKNTDDIHQANPAYVLTVLRFENRDLGNYSGAGLGPGGSESTNISTRDPLPIENDAIAISVSDSKSQPNTSLEVTLKGGDINYMTAIAPGDYIIVNMLNWESEARNIRIRAGNLQPINRFQDGFKGVYRIQDVSESISVDPNSGKKSVNYKLTAFGFIEWVNKIYYNKYLVLPEEKDNQFLFMDRIADIFNNENSKKLVEKLAKSQSVQDILKLLVNLFLGSGLNVNGLESTVGNEKRTKNQHFLIPTTLGKLLGRPNAKHAIDICDIIIGLQKYNESQINDPTVAFKPTSHTRSGKFLESKEPLKGRGLLYADYWSNIPAWSILQKYLNDSINEMYTTFRVNEKNQVVPTVVMRQKPFNTDIFGTFNKTFDNPKLEGVKKNIQHTKFSNLPSWTVGAEMVYNLSVKRSESYRFNFIQLQGRTRTVNPDRGWEQTEQLASPNYDYIKEDVQRSGLKPYFAKTEFDYPPGSGGGSETPNWVQLISDWVVGSHLKLQGTVTMYGVQDPICVGDNFIFNNIRYHIESVNHSMMIDPASGKKTWRTVLSLSEGVTVEQGVRNPIKAQMQYTDFETEAKYNDEEGILPGWSETQDILGRKDSKGEEVTKTPERTFSPEQTSRKNRKK